MLIPEATDTTETAAPAEGDAQPQDSTQESEGAEAQATDAKEDKQPESTEAEGKYPAGPPKEERLADIIVKEQALLEKNPGADLSKDLSAEELDLLDEYYAGDLKPKKKAEKKAEGEGDEEPGTEGETEDLENKDEPGTEDVEQSSVDLQLMKEVGAKTKGELLKKIKGLRKAVSGKVSEAPEVKQLQSDRDSFHTMIQNAQKLFDGARAGDSDAIANIEKLYKLKLVPESSTTETTSKKTGKSSSRPKIDKGKFIDSDAADEVNNVINALFEKVEGLEKAAGDLTAESNTQKKAFTARKVDNDIVDEMVNVSEQITKLKGIKNIREMIVTNLEKMKAGKPTDPKLEYFNDLFEIGNSKKVDLMTALEIDRGRKARLTIAKAKDEGKKEAYERKPNKSLSDLQGRGGEFAKYTEQEVERMIKDNNMPDEWFDKNDEPDKGKIPEKYHKHFFNTY